MRCAFSKALFAILGSRFQEGSWEGGILAWHDNQLDAYRDARELRELGFTCRVVPAPQGNLSEDLTEEVHDLIFDHMP